MEHRRAVGRVPHNPDRQPIFLTELPHPSGDHMLKKIRLAALAAAVMTLAAAIALPIAQAQAPATPAAPAATAPAATPAPAAPAAPAATAAKAPEVIDN